MKAHTVAARDQVLAILRDSGVMPMSTPEVLKAMTNEGRHCNAIWSYRKAVADGTCVRPTSLLPGEPCRGWCWHGMVYAQLTAMLKLGLVERIRLDGHRCVYWRYVVQP